MASGNPPANTATLACRLQRHQRQHPTKHSARINIVLIIVVITRLKRRMAKPEMVCAANSAMAPRQVFTQTMAAP